ncbi:MAG: hypothetical protein WBN92_05080, partial [Terriglobia bacterium]
IFLIIGVQVISFGLLAEMIAFSYRREDDYSIVETSGEAEDSTSVETRHHAQLGGGEALR